MQKINQHFRAVFAQMCKYYLLLISIIMKVNFLSMKRGVTFLNITSDSLFEMVISSLNSFKVFNSLESLPSEYMYLAISE